MTKCLVAPESTVKRKRLVPRPTDSASSLSSFLLHVHRLLDRRAIIVAEAEVDVQAEFADGRLGLLLLLEKSSNPRLVSALSALVGGSPT